MYATSLSRHIASRTVSSFSRSPRLTICSRHSPSSSQNSSSSSSLCLSHSLQRHAGAQQRFFASSCRRSDEAHKNPSKASPATPQPTSEVKFEVPEPRLSLTFTCTVKDCGTRSTHEFTKRSYERGIVLVECPGCKNRHLIADHLGWFKESTEEGKLRTVEDLVKAKGEKVRRGRIDAGGVIEYTPE